MWKFNPIVKKTVWGGNKIVAFRRLSIPETDAIIGESWEISSIEGSETIVAEGNEKGLTLRELIARYGHELLGKRNFKTYGEKFPILIKFIDAKDDLSVQVHPGSDYFKDGEKGSGKNEMWYIIHAEKDACLAGGFNRKVAPDEYPELAKSGKITEVLRYHKVKKGETYYIPAGRVHAIGKGTFLAEIQQTSDITFRIFDYHRKGCDGKERELHIEQACKATDFNDTECNAVSPVRIDESTGNLVATESFTVNIISGSKKFERDYRNKDSFVILTCVEGSAKISSGEGKMTLETGDSVLMPAVTGIISVEPEAGFKALETYIE